MYAKKNMRNKGFTLIEILIVVGVIAILAAIAIPNYLGLQGRAKKRVITEVAASAKPELYHWMEAAIKNQDGVIDVDGDGLARAGEIHTNLLTVPDSWVQAFASKKGYTPLSPWFPKDLFIVGAPNPLTQAGQIVLSSFHGGRGIRILAYGPGGETLFIDSVSSE